MRTIHPILRRAVLVALAPACVHAGAVDNAPAQAESSAANGSLSAAQQTEIAERMQAAQALIARVAPDAAARALPVEWQGDAIRLLLALPAASLKALLSAPALSTVEALHGAARKARGGASVSAKALGSNTDTLIFNPITPCRNADTRNAGGKIAGGTARAFDADQAATQGGTPGCGVVPVIDASAWALNITVVNMTTTGFVAVRSVGATSLTATANFTGPGQQVNNFVIVQNDFSSGSEWEVYASTSVDVIIDLYGYFRSASPVALDCGFVASASVAVPVDAWTAIDAACPAGYSVTGGGHFTTEGTGGYQGVWTLSVPSGNNGWRTWVDNQTNGDRSVSTYAQCCRVP